MLKREQIMAELWSRLSSVTGVVYTARNPKKPPNVDNLPAIQVFEFPDTVKQVSQRGGYPIYKRSMEVVIEVFVSAANEGRSSRATMEFLLETKKAVYQGGQTLGGLCRITEVDASRVLRPATGGNVSGIGLTMEIDYVEDVSEIM